MRSLINKQCYQNAFPVKYCETEQTNSINNTLNRNLQHTTIPTGSKPFHFLYTFGTRRITPLRECHAKQEMLSLSFSLTSIAIGFLGGAFNAHIWILYCCWDVSWTNWQRTSHVVTHWHPMLCCIASNSLLRANFDFVCYWEFCHLATFCYLLLFFVFVYIVQVINKNTLLFVHS